MPLAPDVPWTTYNYSLTGMGSTLLWAAESGTVIGNATIQTRARRVAGVAYFEFIFIVGSTTQFGSPSANWSWTLPTQLIFGGTTVPAGIFTLNTGQYAAPAWTENGGAIRSGVAVVNADPVTYAADFVVFIGSSGVNATSPASWAAGDVLAVSGAVQAFSS